MSVRFDAITDGLSRSATLPGGANLTFSTWVNLAATETAGFTAVLWMMDGSGYYFYLAYGTTTNYPLIVSNQGGGWATGTSFTIFHTVGDWHHLALVKTGASLDLYVDGIYDSNVTDASPLLGAYTSLSLGYIAGSGWNYNGLMSAGKMWTAALNADEILQESRYIRPLRTANLYAFWPLLQHTDIVDYGGAGNTLTANGTLTTEGGPPIPWGPSIRREWIWKPDAAADLTPTATAGVGDGSASTGTPGWPTHVAGDIGLLFVESCGGEPVTLSTPSGFVQITNSPQATGLTTAGTQLTVFWCRATSASMTAPVIADAGNHVWGTIIAVSGCDSSASPPINISAGSVKAGATTTTTFPDATTTLNDCLVILAAARDTDSAAAAWTGVPSNAALSSIALLYDAGTALGNGGGLGIFSGKKRTPGAIGTSTISVASSINAQMTIALMPPQPIQFRTWRPPVQPILVQ